MITIIGSGICGLFVGFLCKRSNIDFEILEKEVYTGGRVYTDYTSYDFPVELGASIFHSNQKLILYLLNYFDVEYGPIKNGETQMDIECKKVKYPKYANKKVKDVIDDICNPGMDEIENMNYNTWQKSKKEEGEILICKHGLEELTDKMAKYVQEHIRFNQKVSKINKNNIIVNGKKKYFETLFVCTSLLEAKQIMYVPDVVETIPSLRFYIEFKDKQKFPYRYRVSDKNFRWCIVLHEKLLLASYLDGKRAVELANLGEQKAKEIILYELDIDESEIKKTWFMYWEKGFEIVKWDKQVDGLQEIQENVYQTFIPDIERNGQDQAWIEAHLRTALSCFGQMMKKK